MHDGQFRIPVDAGLLHECLLVLPGDARKLPELPHRLLARRRVIACQRRRCAFAAVNGDRGFHIRQRGAGDVPHRVDGGADTRVATGMESGQLGGDALDTPVGVGERLEETLVACEQKATMPTLGIGQYAPQVNYADPLLLR